MNWTIALPVFGREYCEKFFDVTLPRLAECLDGFANAGRMVRWIVHTDRPTDINQRIPGAQCIRVPSEFNYSTFVAAHKEAWALTNVGERICFLCADLVPSKTAFWYAEEVLDRGFKAVVTPGIRTFAPEPPRIGADTEELFEFAMKYPHKIVSDTFYRTGGSENPTNVYFKNGDSVVMRGFHLHPFAAVKRESSFVGTVDDDLMEHWDESEIHVVTNRGMALIEMSPVTKSQPAGDRPFKMEDFKRCMDQKARGVHKHFAKHRIRILGEADCGDREAMATEGIATV